MTRPYAIKFVERELANLTITKASEIYQRAFTQALEIALQASTLEDIKDLREDIDYIVEQILFNKG